MYAWLFQDYVYIEFCVVCYCSSMLQLLLLLLLLWQLPLQLVYTLDQLITCGLHLWPLTACNNIFTSYKDHQLCSNFIYYTILHYSKFCIMLKDSQYFVPHSSVIMACYQICIPWLNRKHRL